MQSDTVRAGQLWRIEGRKARTVQVCQEPEGLFANVRNVVTGRHSWIGISTLLAKYRFFPESEEQR